MSADVLAAATVRSGAYAVVKRGFDVAAALLLILLTAPLLALSCAAVWLLSGRPLFHRRRVVGRGGRSFDAFKVRTMVADADRVVLQHSELRDAQAGSRKLERDPRVTAVGRVLRRCSLDELPQLVNVVRGEMSLVGPRMLTAEELLAWGPAARVVLGVRPGITGLWQVSGRQKLSRDDRVRLDADYVRRMSLGLDMWILLRTVPVVLSGRGAL